MPGRGRPRPYNESSHQSNPPNLARPSRRSSSTVTSRLAPEYLAALSRRFHAARVIASGSADTSPTPEPEEKAIETPFGAASAAKASNDLLHERRQFDGSQVIRAGAGLIRPKSSSDSTRR